MPEDDDALRPSNADAQSTGGDFVALLDSEFVDEEYLSRAFGLSRTQRTDFAERYGLLPVGERPQLSPFFDAAWYLDQYEDVRRAGVDPLLHFVTYGVFELRSPHPLISMQRIYDDNRELFYREGGCRSLARVLRENLSNPSEYFDVEFYLDRYPQAREHQGGALHHFLEHGKGEWLSPNPYFDPEWYATRNPDLPKDSFAVLRYFIESPARPAAAPGSAPVESETTRAVVVVLGMHRSGTSLCSHVLSALGVDMGETIEPVPSNPRGQWERVELRELQDRVLELFDRGYHSPKHDLPLPDCWWVDPQVRAVQPEIEALLRQQMASGRLFGFKDPRTARLLPMWRQIFRSLGLAPKFVLCLRTPAQVARSLEARDGLDPELGEYRGFVYMGDIFRSWPEDICVIEYEDWFPQPEENLKKLAGFLDIPWNGAPIDISEIVDRRLRHDDPGRGEARNPVVRSLYALARRLVHDPAARGVIAEIVKLSAVQQNQESGEKISPITGDERFGRWPRKGPFFHGPLTPNVFSYWDKPDLTPIQPFIDDWRRHFPAFTILGDPDIESLLREFFPQDLEMYRRIRIPSAKSDVALLLALYKYGGLHIDCHCRVRDAEIIRELLRSLDVWEVILYDKIRTAEPRPATLIFPINSILFARRHSEIIYKTAETVLRNLNSHWERERSEGFVPYDIWGLTLPGSLHEVLIVDTEVPISRVRPEYVARVRFIPEGEGEPITRYMNHSYRRPEIHWSVRQEREVLFAEDGRMDDSAEPLPASSDSLQQEFEHEVSRHAAAIAGRLQVLDAEIARAAPDTPGKPSWAKPS